MQMVINGELEDKNDKINILNPSNKQIVDTVPSGSLDDVKRALEAANKAKTVISEMSSRKVSRILYNIYEDVLKNSNKLAQLITLETGKPISDSINEINQIRRSNLTIRRRI